MTAAVRGAEDVSSHSTINSTALKANDAGTSRPGEILVAHFEFAVTSRTDISDVAITIFGIAVNPREARRSVSRVALPPTNWAVIAPAHTIAVAIERDEDERGRLMTLEWPRPQDLPAPAILALDQHVTTMHRHLRAAGFALLLIAAPV